MRKHFLPASFLLLLAGLAGCAHQSAGGGGGYAGAALGGCEFGEDCYGPDATRYTCVFFQAPSAPARLAIAVATQHHGLPRVVNRDAGIPSSSWTDSGNPGSSVSAAPAPAPMTIAREPVVVASPAAGGRSPR